MPLDAPWNAKRPPNGPQTTVAQWLGRSVRSRPAHDLLETAIAGNQGLLWVIVEGPIAAPRTLDDLSERFGDTRKSLVDCVEQNWSVERHSADALPATRSSLAGSSQAHAI